MRETETETIKQHTVQPYAEVELWLQATLTLELKGV